MTFLIMLAIPVAMIWLWHIYKTKFFPWIESKSDAFPVILDYIMTSEEVKKHTGKIYQATPVYHTISSRYSHNKLINGRYYLGQICNFKIKVIGHESDTFIHIEAKEKGLETRNFVVVEAFIKDSYQFQWLLKPVDPKTVDQLAPGEEYVD